ncbi:MAG: amidohydrolase family protein [Desulfovibrio sp.]|jgi:predicted TIM-barrel fold metal-dependent hydrolase|nr:amidohydrolase family protein [Desulfovibrio sp.]
MKIIDFRFRPNTAEVLDGIRNSSMFKATCEAIHFERRVPQTLPQIVADLDRRGVELSVITGRDCETTYGFPANNGSVLSFVKAYPDKFVGFWGIDPHKGMNAVREIVHAVETDGMRGIAIDPYLAHIPPHEARYYPLYAKCCELGIPVFVTTAPPPQVPRAVMDYVDPRHVDIVARDFPELTIIMSHGGYPFVNEAVFACMRNANVYMDLSEYELAPMADVYVQALNTAIGDKVVFASAHPFVEQAEAIDIYRKLKLTEEVRRKVMYENARRILGLAKDEAPKTRRVAGLSQEMPVPYLPFCPAGNRPR